MDTNIILKLAINPIDQIIYFPAIEHFPVLNVQYMYTILDKDRCRHRVGFCLVFACPIYLSRIRTLSSKPSVLIKLELIKSTQISSFTQCKTICDYQFISACRDFKTCWPFPPLKSTNRGFHFSAHK